MNINQNLFPAVKCFVCGRLHDAEKESFYTIQGNILMGMNGGLVGNNFNKDGTSVKNVYVCVNANCVKKVFKDAFGME